MAEPDPVLARMAATADYEAIQSLATLARDEAVPQRGGELLLDLLLADVGSPERYQGFLHDVDRLCVVGVIDSAVVGYATAAIASGADNRVCMIEELFVHPEAREVGVAAAMLEQAIDWAGTQSCTHVESHVLPGNRMAKNFFERMGMVTRYMRVSASIDTTTAD